MAVLQDSQEAPCAHCAKNKEPKQPLLSATCCEFLSQAEHQPVEAVTQQPLEKSQVHPFTPTYFPIGNAWAPLLRVERFLSRTSAAPIQVNRPLLH
jgi:hypothetical protein